LKEDWAIKEIIAPSNSLYVDFQYFEQHTYDFRSTSRQCDTKYYSKIENSEPKICWCNSADKPHLNEIISVAQYPAYQQVFVRS
jgi:hypothetical protein